MRTYTITECEKADYDELKENMDNREAIEILKHIERGYIGAYSFAGNEDDYYLYKLHVALWRAVDALEKVGVADER